MAKEQKTEAPPREASDVVSVIGPGMEITGDIKCDGTVRVEGRVEGSVHASKSVVVGKGGRVAGDIETQDVIVAGSVSGTISGASRVELQETCRVDGDIRSRRIKLDEGGQVEGRLQMGKSRQSQPEAPGAGKTPEPPRPEAPGRPSLSSAGK